MLEGTAEGRKYLSPGEMKFQCCAVAKYFSLEIKQPFLQRRKREGCPCDFPLPLSEPQEIFLDPHCENLWGFLEGKPKKVWGLSFDYSLQEFVMIKLVSTQSTAICQNYQERKYYTTYRFWWLQFQVRKFLVLDVSGCTSLPRFWSQFAL